ncbi:MAG TPA: DNA primase [Gammaproteobacteria bacterium]|nr:DNA primase [Gammaproteobacteria bacterium]
MATHIPREFIQLLLSRTEIVDLIDGRVPLRKKSNNNYFACCPFHAEKSASFSVSQQKQFYYCFGCGAHGNAIDFLMQYDRLEFPEAIENLAKNAGLEIPREARTFEHPVVSDNLYDLLENTAKLYQQQLKQSPQAINYLKTRGLSGEIAKEFGLGFAPAGWDYILQTLGKTPELKKQLFDTGMLIKKDEGGYYDRFRERIMFPIRDRRGRIIGFGGRILDKGEPKYLNSPETVIFQKGHELYGLYHAQQTNRQLNRVLIVEGYMDVIALFQHGVTYAVATLGTATSATHLQRLFRVTTEIIFCFDGDPAGRTAAWRALLVALPLMQDDIQIRFMFLPDGEDPDSLIRKEGQQNFENRMQNAGTLSQFFFQSLASQSDLSSMDGRARFINLATEHINQLPDSIFRQMMLDELAKRARMNVEQLKTNKVPYKKSGQLKQAARPPSALRLAIMLLIQEPVLAQLIDQPLPLIQLRGFTLLQEMLDFLKQHPDLTTGGLLEFWRDHPEGKSLAKLAQTEHMIPEKGIPNEFLGAISRLRKLGHKQAIQQLIAKASQMDLSPAERQELDELIRSK